MARVTSKLQVTIPKALADQLAIREGDEVEWLTAGDSLRIRPRAPHETTEQRVTERLKGFDEATRRQRRRTKQPVARTGNRGWTREELYHRGSR